MRWIWIKTFVILLLFLPALGAEESVEDLVQRLKEGDDSVIPKLLEHPQEAIAILQRGKSTHKVNTLLKQLGARRHKDREMATQSLIKIGAHARKSVEAYLDENKQDPEIALRCKRILAEKPDEKDTAKLNTQIGRFLIQVKGLTKGQADELWMQIKDTSKHGYIEWLRKAPQFNISQSLVWNETKTLEIPDKKSPTWGLGMVLAYILESDDSEVTTPCIERIVEVLKHQYHGEYARSKLLGRIIALRPDLAPFLLEKKINWFLTDSENKLYYCMTRTGGHHDDYFTEVSDFVQAQKAEIFRLIKDCPPDKRSYYVPYAAILAMDWTTRREESEALRSVLQQSWGQPDAAVLRCVIIAAKALGLSGNELDQAILQVLRKPPKHYVAEMCHTLNEENLAIVTELIPMIKQGNKHAMLAAACIAPDSKAIHAALEAIYFKSDKLESACAAAEYLGVLGKLPPVIAMPKERLEWFVEGLTKEDAYYSNKFVAAVETAADRRLVANRLAPLLPKIAESRGYSNISDLVWRSDAAQEELTSKLVAMLQSDNKKQRSFAVHLLASCSIEARKYVAEIHTGLKKLVDEANCKSLLWAISNIGPTASSLEATVRTYRDKHPKHTLFCLANIAANPMDRQKALKELMDLYAKENKSAMVRMIGLVRAQDDLVRPFLLHTLHQGRPGFEHPSSTKYNDDVISESAQGLARLPAEPETLQAYADILNDAIQQRYVLDHYKVDAILWSLRRRYSQDLKSLQPILKKLPFAYQLSSSYWLTNRAAAK